MATRAGTYIVLKSPREIELMRSAGKIVAQTLALVKERVRPGVTTADLDRFAEAAVRKEKAIPSFKGYRNFPASLCLSVNEQIVHGIPSRTQVLAEGDLVSVDCGAIVDGWHGDAAVTVGVGELAGADRRLSEACRTALAAGVDAVRPDARLTDISYAVQQASAAAAARDGVSYGIVAEYGGHGIGTAMHMEPFVPNLGRPGRGPRLRTGMVLAVEPMLTAGNPQTEELDDGWTVVTRDRSRAAHWEHTVAVTEDGPWLLTVLE